MRRALLGLVVAALTLLLAEGGLRLWGGVADAQVPSPLLFQAPGARWPQPGPKGTSVWGHWRRVTEPQAPGLRVLALGGSTTQGERVGPFQAFGGWLERSLTEATGRPVEVINLGVGGHALRHVNSLLRSALAAERSDLIVLYSGNNEFLEVLAQRYADPGFSSARQLARRRLWRLHGYRLLVAWLVPPPVQPDAMPQPVTAMQVQATSDDRLLVERLYEEGLVEAAAIARAHGVPLLMSTVADNLLGGAGLRVGDADRAWGQAMLGDPQLDGVLANEGAAEAAGWSALGRALWEAGRRDQALVALQHAERLDPAPHRSNHVMRATLLEVAAAEGAIGCDVAGALQRADRIGDETFLDRCHPRPEGHRLIAEAMLACLAEAGWSPAGDTVPAPDPFALDAWDVPLGAALPPAEGWEAALHLGHQAFIERQFERSWIQYRRAEALGAPPETVARSRDLLRLHDPQRYKGPVSLAPLDSP